VLYIASSSRSGSTILEHTLGAIEGVFNCGELRRLKSFYNDNESTIADPLNRVGCTCGFKICDCIFWSKVEEESGIDFSRANISSQLSSVNRFLFKIVFFMLGPHGAKWLSKLYIPFAKEIEAAANCFRIYSAISTLTNCMVIVDSSKLIHQFLMLKTACPESVKMLALFRDGRAVSKSMIRGERKNNFQGGKYSSNHSPIRVFRAAVLSWAVTTLQILFFYYRVSTHSRYFIKYENFCNGPNAIVDDILSKFGMEVYKEHVKKNNFQSHAIGGSPSRFSGTFNKIKIDQRWRCDWSKTDNRVFGCYGSLINRFLGYK
jgi:hypothetical protein